MTLTINDEQIDFTLDNEQFLFEVIDNIKNWLGEDQLIIESLYINAEDYSNKDLNENLLNINTIDIKTISYKELNINNITWIKYFFERLIMAIEKWNIVDLNQVEKEMSFISTHVPTLLSLDNKTPENIFVETLNTHLKKYNYFKCKEEIVNKNEITEYLQTIVYLLDERLNEYITPNKEIKTSIDVLVSIQKELESVAIYMQSGKNDVAANIMNKFTNIFHKILRILNFNLKNIEFTQDKNLEEFTDGLDDVLNELLDGYESQDTVLIGDILEYELSPKIEKLKEIFV